MRILIVNDDGIHGLGLLKLAQTLAVNHSVTVVAPNKQKSGFSHSVHFHKPVFVKPFSLCDGVNAYVLDGSPCDCVKFGTEVILAKSRPDIILCGINDDFNLGTDVVYSATVNAALEGALLGYPSFAVSIDRAEMGDFSYPAQFVEKNLINLLSLERNNSVAYSINFPYNDEKRISGVKFASLGVRNFNDHFEGDEINGYMLLGEPQPISNDDESDVKLIEKGYITITPVLMQSTERDILKRCRLKEDLWSLR